MSLYTIGAVVFVAIIVAAVFKATKKLLWAGICLCVAAFICLRLGLI